MRPLCFGGNEFSVSHSLFSSAGAHLHTAQETVSWRPRPFPRCLEKEVKKENSLGQFRILQRIDFESADFRVGVPAMVI